MSFGILHVLFTYLQRHGYLSFHTHPSDIMRCLRQDDTFEEKKIRDIFLPPLCELDTAMRTQHKERGL
jgi:hypothetical protein